jgi:hypothetical protein
MCRTILSCANALLSYRHEVRLRLEVESPCSGARNPLTTEPAVSYVSSYQNRLLQNTAWTFLMMIDEPGQSRIRP